MDWKARLVPGWAQTLRTLAHGLYLPAKLLIKAGGGGPPVYGPLCLGAAS